MSLHELRETNFSCCHVHIVQVKSLNGTGYVFFIPFQSTRLFQLSARESNIKKVIVHSRALHWGKLVNWNHLEEHIQIQLGVLPVCNRQCH